MKRRAVFFILVIFSLFSGLNTLYSQTITIRLASPLPQNSDWGRALDRITSEWSRVTNNQVRVTVYHGGTQGSENQMLSSLRSNNIQAGLFTSIGISDICPPVMTLSVPFLISNNTELDLVLTEVLPVLDNYMNRTDFVAICWSKGGWVYIFSREQVLEPNDLRRQRLGSSADLSSINSTFRTMGFNLVEAEMTNLGTRIASNAINAIYLIPEALAPMGLHRSLTNMMNLPIAPIMGAIVMNRVTWNRLGAERQRNIVAVTQRIASEFDQTMLRTSSNTLTSMQRDGLNVNTPNQAQIEMWRADINRSIPSLLGTAYDRNIYNLINQILTRERSR